MQPTGSLEWASRAVGSARAAIWWGTEQSWGRVSRMEGVGTCRIEDSQQHSTLQPIHGWLLFCVIPPPPDPRLPRAGTQSSAP